MKNENRNMPNFKKCVTDKLLADHCFRGPCGYSNDAKSLGIVLGELATNTKKITVITLNYNTYNFSKCSSSLVERFSIPTLCSSLISSLSASFSFSSSP